MGKLIPFTNKVLMIFLKRLICNMCLEECLEQRKFSVFLDTLFILILLLYYYQVYKASNMALYFIKLLKVCLVFLSFFD